MKWAATDLTVAGHKKIEELRTGQTIMEKQADPKKVFVVHGRNSKARKALFSFLRSIGLHPIEWLQAVEMTGKASPYVGEILDKAFSVAQAAVILFTPDDVAMLREDLRGNREPTYETELTGQARPNVIFEAGMAMGLYPDRTLLIELGNIRPISDITGRHIIRLNNTIARRQELAQRLKTAGCSVNLSGTDWHEDGDFEVAFVPKFGDKNTALTPTLPADYKKSVEQVTTKSKWVQSIKKVDRDKQPTVFLSYAQKDIKFAETIIGALKERNVKIWNENLLTAIDDSPSKHLNEVLSASDYLIVLLSPNFWTSRWLHYEIEAFSKVKELNNRDVTLIPIIIEDTEIPKSIQNHQILDCRFDKDKRIHQLIEQISSIPEIDFSQLDSKIFENLVEDLLIKLNFKNIEKQVDLKGFNFDLKADYLRPDNFGAVVKETWLAECRFYKHSRADLKTIQQILLSLSNLDSKSFGLLVTNSQLTSVTNEYLEQLKNELRKDIRVIDGTELKRLLLTHSDLIHKYFPTKEEVE